MENCKFCNNEILKQDGIIKNESCILLTVKNHNPEGILEGSCIIIPFAHKETPFDLSEKEMIDTLDLLKKAKEYLDEKHKPDGYSLGWNVGKTSGQSIEHVHLHIMPRYNDEPLTGKGIRHFFRQEENKRL